MNTQNTSVENRMQRMQAIYNVYAEDLEPIMVEDKFICYVEGSYFEDYYASCKENPCELVKKLLLTKGDTIQQGLDNLFEECNKDWEKVSFYITKYLDRLSDKYDYDKKLYDDIYNARRTKEHVDYLTKIKEKYPPKEY